MSAARDAAMQLCAEYWETLLSLDPLFGTFIGDERHDDSMPDPREEGRARRQAMEERALERLERLDRQGLDEDARITLEILGSGARRGLSDLGDRVDQLEAVTHNMTGPGNLLADLASTQRADTPERLERYEARLAAVPGYIDALADVGREGLAEGRTQPDVVIARAAAQIERLLAMPPEASPGMELVKGAPPEARERVAVSLREGVWPAYGRYLEMLRDYLPRTRRTIGLLALPDGEAMYARRLEAHTTLPLDPRRVHETGLEQLDRIMEERRRLAGRLGFASAEAAIAAHTAGGGNTASSREEFLERVRDQVRRGWDAAPAFFGRLPHANCDVVAVEEFREADMPGAFYQSPSMDGTRPGLYFVNTGDVRDRLLHQTATTSFHEANPGHHFHLSIEQEFTDRHPLRRFNPGGGAAFIEGWGLYSERLADEMGLYLDDYERIGMLEAQAFRAGRLIVDTGIHALGWDRERAVRQMMATGSPRMECEIEVDRYISWPGQACAYMIGSLEIGRWRRELSSEMGSRFDLRSFHDRLLALGSVPLGVLDRELRATFD